MQHPRTTQWVARLFGALTAIPLVLAGALAAPLIAVFKR